MGRRGPAPKPTAIKIAKGETRPSRVNHQEPAFPAVAGELAAPKGLTGEGLKEWRRVEPMLSKTGALKQTDLMALEDYCRAITDLRRYERVAVRAGTELAIAKGYQGMVIKLRQQANQLRQQLGLTPSSRSGVKADGVPNPQNEDERFFGGPQRVVGGRDA